MAKSDPRRPFRHSQLQICSPPSSGRGMGQRIRAFEDPRGVPSGAIIFRRFFLPSSFDLLSFVLAKRPLRWNWILERYP